MKSTGVLKADFILSLGHFPLRVVFETHDQVTGVFGPSGCGKTSFLEVVAGLRRQAQGRVTFANTVWQDSSKNIFVKPEDRGIGYVPQDGLLFPHQTVRENLEAGGRRAKIAGNGRQNTMSNVIELLELGNMLDRNVRMLSGGERQRVSLGRAICSAPKLILLDEPLASLDQPLRRRILPFLRRIREEFAIPMILVSHEPIEVQALCDDLIILQQGTVVAQGSPREVLMDPAIFSTAGDRGFENVIPCSTIAADEWQTTVLLGSPPTELSLKLLNRSIKGLASKFVGISARDILVATKKPTDISARNILPAVIQEMYSLECSELIKARLHQNLPPIAVEVGHSACKALALQPGKEIYLIIKSMTCTLYEDHQQSKISRVSTTNGQEPNKVLPALSA